jgi:HlyD family secretion protein
VKGAVVFVALAAAAVGAASIAWRDTGRLRHRVVRTGTVEARQASVAAEVGGKVSSFAAAEGQKLRKGEPIAVLDSSEAQLRVVERQARVRSAQAELTDLRSLPRPEDLELQRSRVAEAELRLADAHRELDRVEKLHLGRVATEQAWDAAKSALALAQQRRETAKRELAQVAAGPRPGQIEAAEAHRQQLEQELALAKLSVERATVRAPFDGVLLRRECEEGEMLQQGSPVARLIDLSLLWVELSIDPLLYGKLVLGQPATVTAEAGGAEHIAGRVTFLADRHSFTPRSAQTEDERARLTYRAKVELATPPAWLKPGMFARVELGPQEKEQAHAQR